MFSCYRFYGLDEIEHDVINKYLSGLVENAIRDLEQAYCLEVLEVWLLDDVSRVQQSDFIVFPVVKISVDYHMLSTHQSDPVLYINV